MIDPIQLKEQKIEELDEEIRKKTQQIIDLVNKANAAKDKFLKMIASVEVAGKEAINEYMEFINELEVIRVRTEEVAEKT
jgi:hypothetical protein